MVGSGSLRKGRKTGEHRERGSGSGYNVYLFFLDEKKREQFSKCRRKSILFS